MSVNFRCSKLDVRGLQYHIQEWGDASNPTLFLLHGWMDCGATFKFVASELQDRFHLVAPDFRGFGESDHAPGGYYFPDYFADVDVIFSHYSPDTPINLIGHSMGGQVALMYAGIRPERVARLLSLEAAGLPETKSEEAPQKYRQWIRQILSNEPSKVYPHIDMLRRSIHKGNPSLSDAMIDELAELWGKPVGEDGAVMLKHDHAHRYTNPVRYNYADAVNVWKEITARVGLVMAADSWMYDLYTSSGRIDEVRQLMKIAEQDYFVLPDCHHMLHLERPQKTAECIAEFFA